MIDSEMIASFQKHKETLGDISRHFPQRFKVIDCPVNTGTLVITHPNSFARILLDGKLTINICKKGLFVEKFIDSFSCKFNFIYISTLNLN